jgi:hypothetical protein
MVFLCLTTWFFMFSSSRIAYVTRAASFLEQAQSIVAPYVSAEERIVLRSRAARIASQEDFISLITYMEGIAKKNDVKVPSFSAF